MERCENRSRRWIVGDGDEFSKERRVRIHFSQTAKGAVTLDVTSEAESVEMAASNLQQGLVALEGEIEKRGLKTADKI